MKNVWRYDNQYLTLENVGVQDDTPIGVWLLPTIGVGGYCYSESLDEIKEIIKADINYQIKILESKLEDLILTS